MIRRRKPLKPGRPPRRRTWLKQHRARKRRTAATRSEAYKAAVRLLPCVGCPDGRHAPGCRTFQVREASHLGRDGGMSMKASDDSCIPQTSACHSWTQRRGLFEQAVRRAWALDRIAETRAKIYGAAAAEAAQALVEEGRIPW